MKEEIKQVVEAISSHPKTSVALVAAVNTNTWWIDYGEPIVKVSTSILGLVVLGLLVVKHILDIKKEHFTNKD